MNGYEPPDLEEEAPPAEPEAPAEPPKSRSHLLAERMTASYADQLEREFRQERKDAAEELWNAFGDVIQAQTPSVETLIYVLRMMEHDVLTQRHRLQFGPGDRVGVETKPSEDGQASAAALAIG